MAAEGGVMPALSFQGEWLDKLLSGEKQQTTRPPTDRIKVGDVVHIYNQQRRRIKDKPLRRLTDEGYGKMEQLSRRGQMKYPSLPFAESVRLYPAHFLGKVEITKVYLFVPVEMATFELQNWAQADGFKDPNLGFTAFEIADTWFRSRYGDDWMHKTWTVIRWNGWMVRYFEPESGGD